jgi:hypothetical protein
MPTRSPFRPVLVIEKAVDVCAGAVVGTDGMDGFRAPHGRAGWWRSRRSGASFATTSHRHIVACSTH